jgi:hypothetical protein
MVIAGINPTSHLLQIAIAIVEGEMAAKRRIFRWPFSIFSAPCCLKMVCPTTSRRLVLSARHSSALFCSTPGVPPKRKPSTGKTSAAIPRQAGLLPASSRVSAPNQDRAHRGIAEAARQGLGKGCATAEIVPDSRWLRLLEHEDLIRSGIFDSLPAPVRPADIERGFRRRTQSKVQPQAVGRIEAGLAEYLLRLYAARVPGDDARAWRRSAPLTN